jgi:TM2 domain-containing membrane protein YozV
LAAVLSFLIPGLGQIYNGQIMKDRLIVVIQAINVAGV